MRGRIKGLATRSNTGFLRGSNETFDRFFHAGVVVGSVSLKDMEVDDIVDFEPISHARGQRAQNVRVVAKQGDYMPPDREGPYGEDEDRRET